MSDTDRAREHLIDTYRKKARHYDVTSRLYPAPGYPQHRQRLRAVRALDLSAGDTVVDLACGTGLNFALIEDVIGPAGRIIGVDLTDAMLARAHERIAANGWRNVSLEQADAADFDFPAQVDGIVSTYALSQVPECAQVITDGAAALSEARPVGRPGSQGPRRHAGLAGRARQSVGPAFRRSRRVGRPAAVDDHSHRHAGRPLRLLDGVVLRNRVPRRRFPRLTSG